MKVEFVIKDYKPKLIFKYTDEEVKKLQELFERLGLEIAETHKGFGNQHFKYYREKNEEVLKYLNGIIKDVILFNCVDDINEDLITNTGKVNISVFRIVPVDNKVEIDLPKYLTIREFDILMCRLTTTYSYLFNIVSENLEIEIKVKKGGDEK